MSKDSSILIVSDMADLMATRAGDRELYNGMDFVFACRDGSKLKGYHYETVYISARADLNMSVDVRRLVANQRTKGSKLCPVS